MMTKLKPLHTWMIVLASLIVGDVLSAGENDLDPNETTPESVVSGKQTSVCCFDPGQAYDPVTTPPTNDRYYTVLTDPPTVYRDDENPAPQGGWFDSLVAPLLYLGSLALPCMLPERSADYNMPQVPFGPPPGPDKEGKKDR